MKYTAHLRDWLFRQVHGHNLVYNTCWEDPRCDRELLQLDRSSRVVMITSAGCNVLDYLLDDPAEVHAIDVNPRQNALLALKRAALCTLPAGDLFRLFGRGRHPGFEVLYRDLLAARLPDYARAYWDDNPHFFHGRGQRRTFYHYGTAGTVAWLAERYLRSRPRVFRQVQALFAARTLEDQQLLYQALEERVLNQFVQWCVNRHLTMCLLGVPRAQQQLFRFKYPDGALGFIRECLRRVFTQLPISENYFWQLYFHGAYTRNCCPNYLRAEHQPVLAERQQRIFQYNQTITDFLQAHPGTYSHFVLLDHQDWLAAHDRPALEAEWRLILANSRPGTRILLRSAAVEIDFFPHFVWEAVSFHSTELAEVHRRDRVGTYGSVYLGKVK